MEYVGLGFCLMLIGVAMGVVAAAVAEEILDERCRRKVQRRRPQRKTLYIENLKENGAN